MKKGNSTAPHILEPVEYKEWSGSHYQAGTQEPMDSTAQEKVWMLWR